MFVHSATTQGATLNSKTAEKNPIFFGFSKKMGKQQLQSWFWHFSSTGIKPAICHMRHKPLAHLGKCLRYQFGLHCYDVALPNQHFNILHIQTKRWSYYFCMIHCIWENDTSYMYHPILLCCYNTFCIGLKFELKHPL